MFRRCCGCRRYNSAATGGGGGGAAAAAAGGTVIRRRFGPLLTLLGPQSRSGDNWGQITWNLSALSPKWDWSSKGVKR